MQSIVKCITILSMLSHYSIGFGAICICNHDLGTDSSHHHANLDHSEHHNSELPVEHDDCSFKPCECSFVTTAPLQIVTMGESFKARSIDMPTSSQNSSESHYNPDDLCNSYADTIRVRAQIWIL